MSAKINHVAIVSQQYALLANFYQSIFGMRTSKTVERTVRAITVGDGYVGLNINPRKAGRPAGLDHVGFTVENIDTLKKDVEEAIGANPIMNPIPLGRGKEGAARLELAQKMAPYADHFISDPDFTLISISGKH